MASHILGMDPNLPEFYFVWHPKVQNHYVADSVSVEKVVPIRAIMTRHTEPDNKMIYVSYEKFQVDLDRQSCNNTLVFARIGFNATLCTLHRHSMDMTDCGCINVCAI